MVSIQGGGGCGGKSDIDGGQSGSELWNGGVGEVSFSRQLDQSPGDPLAPMGAPGFLFTTTNYRYINIIIPEANNRLARLKVQVRVPACPIHATCSTHNGFSILFCSPKVFWVENSPAGAVNVT